VTGNRPELGGSFPLGPGRVHRAGYGAMQLAGDGVFGPPRDRDEAPNVLLIPGTRTRVHLAENLGAPDVRLDDAAHAELTRHFRIAR
jgi:hypothetical protein